MHKKGSGNIYFNIYIIYQESYRVSTEQYLTKKKVNYYRSTKKLVILEKNTLYHTKNIYNNFIIHNIIWRQNTNIHIYINHFYFDLKERFTIDINLLTAPYILSYYTWNRE